MACARFMLNDQKLQKINTFTIRSHIPLKNKIQLVFGATQTQRNNSKKTIIDNPVAQLVFLDLVQSSAAAAHIPDLTIDQNRKHPPCQQLQCYLLIALDVG